LSAAMPQTLASTTSDAPHSPKAFARNNHGEGAASGEIQNSKLRIQNFEL
jgi:hypothetical protein